MNPTRFRSERQLGQILARVLVVVPAVLLGLLAMARFGGLTDPLALAHADLARHLARGDGFATNVLQPLTVALGPSGQPAADILHAPGQSMLLSLVYRLAGPSDKGAAIMGLLLWLAALGLLFLVARRWWGERSAGLAVVLALCVNSYLVLAVSGLPESLLGVWVLAALALVIPPQQRRQDELVDLPAWRPALAGVLCGLAVLTDYAMIGLALVVGWTLLQSAKRGMNAVGWFGLGLVLVVGPWLIRNDQVTGHGWLGGYPYHALASTSLFPGDSLWRSMSVEPHPVLQLLLQPLDGLRKLAGGMFRAAAYAGQAFGPVIGFLVIAAAIRAPARSRRGSLARLALTSMILVMAWSSVFDRRPALWLAWTPVLAAVAGTQLVAWTESSIRRLVLGGWRLPWRRHLQHFRRLELSIGLSRGLVQLAVMALAVLPLLVQVSRWQRLAAPTAPWRALEELRELVPERGIIMTDAPEQLAWFLDRPVIDLPHRESALDQLETVTGPLHAIYLSRSFPSLFRGDWQNDWWAWAASERGIYRGLVDVTTRSLPGFLRTPLPLTEAEEQAAVRVANAREIAQRSGSPDDWAKLAEVCFRTGRLRESHLAWEESIRLDPQVLEAWLGSWYISAQVTQPDATLRLAAMIPRLNPDKPQERLSLEEAADHFDYALRRSNDPWLLMNAAKARIKLGQWDQAEALYRRLGTVMAGQYPTGLLLGQLYFQQGNLDQAAAACEALLAEQPQLASAHELLGRIRQAQGRATDALREFDSVLRLRPYWIGPRMTVARLEIEQGRYEIAAAHFEHVLELRPALLEAELGLAETRARQEAYPEAIAVYSRILKDHPYHPLASNNLAEFLVRTGRAPDAVTLLQTVVAAHPQNAVLRDSLGWACFQAGNRGTAAQHLREAIRLAPRQAMSHYRLGKVLAADGRADEARTAFAAALKYGLNGPERVDAKNQL